MPENKDTEIALIKQQLGYIQNSIARMEEANKDTRNMMSSFIDTARNTFATKIDHTENRKEIDAMKSTVAKTTWTALVTIILSILGLILKKLGIY